MLKLDTSTEFCEPSTPNSHLNITFELGDFSKVKNLILLKEQVTKQENSEPHKDTSEEIKTVN